VQEVDHERQEERLTVDHVRGLHPSVERNLLLELREVQERVTGARDGRAFEVEQLSWLAMAISETLVDLNVLPLQGIPMQLQLAKGVLTALGLILERLREVALAHDADTWSGWRLYCPGSPDC
jgi:hypothetical protein